ncbi:MAG: cytochrome C, partial [Rhodospirillales bacterium]|nr:cytochrome C [Rhodospirillales bacterium]
IKANAMVTPAHIVPEWYFLPFYAILRAFTADFFMYWPIAWLMSAKLAGVLAMFASILLLLVLPWLDLSKVRSSKFRPINKQFFWIFFLNCLVLGWIGGKPAEGTYIIIGQVSTFYYFFHLVVLVPLIGLLERPKPIPESISSAVTQAAK